MKKINLLLLLFAFSVSNIKAQDLGEILEAGAADASLYFEQYVGPVAASFTNGLGAGWYNTAKPHKLLGFDLTFGVNLANIPSGERTFDYDDVNWNTLQLASGSSSEFPTIVGGFTDSELVIPANVPIDVGNGQTITYEQPIEFPALDGADVEGLPVVGFPVPYAQLGVGLPKNTDLKVRIIPSTEIEDVSLSLIGVGVMHDIKQWVPGLKQIPFDFSGFIGWTRFSLESSNSESSENLVQPLKQIPFDFSGFIGWTRFSLDSEFDDSSAEFSGSGAVEISASSFTMQGIISKKLAIFTPYVGLGFVVGSSSLDVTGQYEYTESSTGQTVTVNDPISLDFDGGSSPRLNAGLRLKLLILTFHAEYALQKYNTLTAGVGISIR